MTLRKKAMEGADLSRDSVHPFPARMAPGIALRAFSTSRRKLKVLDPMMGSGTVLVAARDKGHYAVGVDIDPLAVLIGRVWSMAVDRNASRRAAKRVLKRACRELGSLRARAAAYPENVSEDTKSFIRYWFDANARRELAALSRSIGRCNNLKIRDVLWCSFSRLIIAKQAGASLALDLAHSRPHRHFRIAPIRPIANFLRAVDRVLESCLSSNERNRGPEPKVSLGDARKLSVRSGTIDLVLTSPPYVNAIDYFRCSKFSLVWMGYNIDDLRYLRSVSVGTEVGDYDETGRNFASDMLVRMKLVNRLSRRKQAVLKRFIHDMHFAVNEVHRVLAPGGKAIYVIGENTITGIYVENAKIIIALARKAGLTLVSQRKRYLPPNRRYLPPPGRGRKLARLDKRMRREVILQFTK